MSHRREKRRERRRSRREQPFPALRVLPKWGGPDYIYPCPFCDWTSEGQATFGVALHVHFTHPGKMQAWKLRGRDWTVAHALPAPPDPTIKGGRVESVLFYDRRTQEAVGYTPEPPP